MMTDNTFKIFNGKRVTIIGLGLLGGALNDAIYLAEHGAKLTITDLKSREELKPSLEKLEKYQGIKFVLGEHRLEDFEKADFILQPGNVPLNSPYLALAIKNGIPVYVSESLFFENLPAGVKTVGVTGTRGKSTTAKLIFEILENSPSTSLRPKKSKIFLAGNTKGVSTLALLDQVKAGDTVVMELDSWALHALGEFKKSPNVAVFTNLMIDHQNFYGSTPLATGQIGMDAYFADKAQIFLHQQPGDEFICGPEVLKLIQNKYAEHSGRAIVPDLGILPKNWAVKVLGGHNLKNIVLAVTAARVLDVPEDTIKEAVENFTGVPGRLEFVLEREGIRYYNDTTATTPDATLAALEALRGGLSTGSGIILISGGTDKALDYAEYVKTVSKTAKALILFKGTATTKILEQLKVKSEKLKVGEEFVIPAQAGIQAVLVGNMKDAVKAAKGYAKKGDIILLSPGAASFGIFKNEFDRGEQFVELVKS
jgi:UDP-N-acetylmuramoylalanine--D-glutamate ligase